MARAMEAYDRVAKLCSQAKLKESEEQLAVTMEALAKEADLKKVRMTLLL